MSNPIQSFFDHLAPSYARKYSSEQVYLQFFFTTRLELATENLTFQDATILDIGAGTGALYEYIKKQNPFFHYFACDISEKMLQAGSIPEECRYVGEVDRINWPVKQFDYIFALGLTSYLDDKQMERLLAFCAQHLRKGGRVVVSFTNGSSLEVRIRYLLQPLIRQFLRRKNRLVGQEFKTRAYALAVAKEAFIAKNLYYCNLKWISPSIPFLHHWMPQWSVKSSKFLAKKKVFSFLNRWLSHEFILSFQVNGTKTERSKA